MAGVSDRTGRQSSRAGWDVALEALELRAHEPVLGLPEEAKDFFWADEHAEAAGRFAVLIVLEGRGEIDGQEAFPGRAFVVPAASSELRVTGELRVLRCLAPDAGYSKRSAG